MNENYKKTLLVISFFLLIIFIYQLTLIPGGFFFSSLFYSIIISILISLCITILTFIAKFLFKKQDFLFRLSLITIIVLSITIYKLYSPTLKIIVPKNYSGEVNLVLSNLDYNELNIDKNGIGYITKWTFEKTYTKPNVYDTDGNDLSSLLLSYDNNKFWGKSIGSENTIKSLSFEIAKDTSQKSRTHISNWLENIDLNKVYLKDPTKKPENIIDLEIK